VEDSAKAARGAAIANFLNMVDTCFGMVLSRLSVGPEGSPRHNFDGHYRLFKD